MRYAWSICMQNDTISYGIVEYQISEIRLTIGDKGIEKEQTIYMPEFLAVTRIWNVLDLTDDD